MSAIDERYEELGGAGGILGDPVTDEAPMERRTRSATASTEHGAIYWWVRAEGRYRPGQHVASVCEVYGAIWDAFKAFGRHEGFLGAATSGETACHDGVGRFNTFQEGADLLDARHRRARGAQAQSVPRGPVSAPRAVPGLPDDGRGSVSRRGRPVQNHFQNGSCYWTEATGAHEVQAITRSGRRSDAGDLVPRVSDRRRGDRLARRGRGASRSREA